MKRFSTMLAVSLAVSLVVAACASMRSGGGDLVTRAVSAQGGADALAAVKTISYKATVRQWEPEQSAKAGGEMRLAGDSTAVTVMDVAAGATRIDWVKQLPVPGPAHLHVHRDRHPAGRLRGGHRQQRPHQAEPRGESAGALDVERPARRPPSASCSPPHPC